MDHENTSRRASIEPPNPNVFSDEYALDPAEALGDLSPVDSIDSRSEQLTVNHGNDVRQHPREYTPVGISGHRTSQNRLSMAERASPFDLSDSQRAHSVSSRSIADTRRTLSTSSHFSIPRTQSPYRGPTAPSQPYAAYPQVTRASSIASESTIRPNDRPFILHGGPEHPYSMYPQNTVAEEENSSDTQLPRGFPVLGQSFPTGSNSSGDDVGDIVGSDGHVEQLPPYSRYADNVIAKGDMARLDQQRVSIGQNRSSAATVQPDASSATDMELTVVGSATSSEEVSRKEGFVQKKMKRTCCGLPVWTWLILAVVVCLATVLGGVIGGVVGNRKGASRALASGAATTTVWLDADPAETGPSTPSCPTGHFTLPLNLTQEIDSCVVDDSLTHLWGCMDFAKLGINVFESSDGGPPLSVVFDDYSVRPQLFRYGPQPPDFNGTAFEMQPFKDKDDDELGIALFFSVLFDKLSILPAEAFPPPPPPGSQSKRSMPMPQLQKRGFNWTPNYLNIGDQPWYCFWNSTVNEFWIFLDQNVGQSAASSAPSTITSGSSMPTGTSSGMSASSPQHSTQTPTDSPAMGGSSPSQPTSAGYWGGGKAKRQATGAGSLNYPKLAKMVEKRKPDSNIPPYCQQMQVLNNWQIMPIPNVPTIAIEESEYNPTGTPGANKMAIRKRSDTVQELSSNCICEWFSV